jgi:hypothetical protein
MHTNFTPDLARQIVNDKLRDADGRRLARATRAGRRTAAATDGASTEPVVRRASRLAVFFAGRTAQAH